jgi:hypothetical protein
VYIQFNPAHHTSRRRRRQPPPPATTRREEEVDPLYLHIIRIIRRHVIEYVGTWMEHHRSQREEKAVVAAAAAAANVMYGRAIYT